MENNKLVLLGILGFIVSFLGGYFFKGLYAKKHDNTAGVELSLKALDGAKNLVDVAVLGSGPAGLSAALYGARLGNKTLIFLGDLGGQLTKTTYVENWPGSKKIMGSRIIEGLEKQAKSFGACVLADTVVKVDLSTWPFLLYTQDDRVIRALSLIVATGAAPKKLGIPGESEYWGRGVTTCAICDAPFYRGKEVVVVGGGDSALEEAIQLSAYAAHITILVRKSELRASYAMQKRVGAIPTISIQYNKEVEEILGNESNVTDIVVRDSTTNQREKMAIDGVFLAIGHTPNTGILKGQLELNNKGYIVLQGNSERMQETSVHGVFAAGDVEDEIYRQAGVAAGRGIAAGIDADRFLQTAGFTKALSKKLEEQGAYFQEVEGEIQELQRLSSVHDFERAVTKKSGLVVVDFYADYCPSCIQMLPIVAQVAANYAEQATFYKVDVNEAKELVKLCMVPKVPYMIIYNNGVPVAFLNKTMSKAELSHIIESFISADTNDSESEEFESEED